MPVAESNGVSDKERASLRRLVVNPTTYDRAFRLFDRVYEPDKVERVLRAGLNGDLNDQALLFDAMIDTWPELQAAIGDMADDISGGGWEVQPGEDTEPAQLVAEDVEAMLMSMKGSHLKRKLGLCETMKELVYGYYYGHVVLENGWEPAIVNGSQLWAVTHTKAVDPIYYRYPWKAGEVDELRYAPDGRKTTNLEDFAEHKFLVGINKAHRAHPAFAAPLRSLVGYWLAANFGLKWFMRFAQLYGVPIRWATFPQGDDCTQALLEEFLENMGSSGYAVIPDGSDLKIANAPGGTGMPQDRLIEIANKAVSRFIFGATLTTDVGDSGSRALGDVHQKAKDRRTQALWCFVADIFNDQLIPSFIEVNGYRVDQYPRIVRPEEESVADQLAKAELDNKLFSSTGMRLPVAKDYIYERHGIPMPAADDELYEPVMAPNPFEGGPFGQDPKEQEDEEEEPEEGKVAAIKANRKTLNTDILKQLEDNVSKEIPEIAGAWLDPIKPIFEKLVAAAVNPATGLDEFQRLLVEAQNEIPEVELKTDVLQDALERAVGSAMLAGAGQRAIDFKP